MKKNHYIYIGVGVAVLLVLYFAFSCKDCKGKFTAKVKQETAPTEAANNLHEQKEV